MVGLRLLLLLSPLLPPLQPIGLLLGIQLLFLLLCGLLLSLLRLLLLLLGLLLRLLCLPLLLRCLLLCLLRTVIGLNSRLSSWICRSYIRPVFRTTAPAVLLSVVRVTLWVNCRLASCRVSLLCCRLARAITSSVIRVALWVSRRCCWLTRRRVSLCRHTGRPHLLIRAVTRPIVGVIAGLTGRIVWTVICPCRIIIRLAIV